MTATAEAARTAPMISGVQKRFERVAISSVFGDPLDRRTWSAAPFNLGQQLKAIGIAVEGVATGALRGEQALLATHYSLMGYGAPRSREAVLRMLPARRRAAIRLASAMARLGISDALHTGSLDLMPAEDGSGIRHYLYCDHTWSLSLLHRPDRGRYSARAVEAFELLEHKSLSCATHIFTFGTYVRDHIIEHYGIPAERVTAVGSGMGNIEAYAGEKDYGRPQLLFVAKHLFAAKGGNLLLSAFRIARQHRPDLQLTIVGDERSRAFVPDEPGIIFHAHLPWEELQRLYRDSTLLTQPMLNDPWGQVYLEALMSRTPVLGLRRNGLPEIVENGRYGFLVDEADPNAVATAILDAVSDPECLARKGEEGQKHVLQNYSWNTVAQRIAFI